jgi:hypothetical protein
MSAVLQELLEELNQPTDQANLLADLPADGQLSFSYSAAGDDSFAHSRLMQLDRGYAAFQERSRSRRLLAALSGLRDHRAKAGPRRRFWRSGESLSRRIAARSRIHRESGASGRPMSARGRYALERFPRRLRFLCGRDPHPGPGHPRKSAGENAALVKAHKNEACSRLNAARQAFRARVPGFSFRSAQTLVLRDPYRLGADA